MFVTIICIGDELLIGQVTDTNSGSIARALAPYGWEVRRVITVPDSSEAISAAVSDALASTQVVLVTGGLGPTKDDITKPTLARFFGSIAMRRDESVLENVERIFREKGLPLNDLTRAQADVPEACTVIPNRFGTAPVMWFEKDGKVLVSMPGVPSETEAVFPSEVIPRLMERFSDNMSVEHRTLTLYGIGESHLAERIADWEQSLPAHLHLAYLPADGIIRLRIDCRHTRSDFAKHEADRAAAELRGLVSDFLLAEGDFTPARILLDKLSAHGLTFATAESCTGGNVAHLVTMVPGSSRSMLGGVVSYSNSVKENLLGVKAETLAAHGAVSVETAREMAEGAQRATGADIAVSTTGIAGPGGAVEGKPVGTVCIGVATPHGVSAGRFRFGGNRAQVIARASTAALVEAITRIITEYEK